MKILSHNQKVLLIILVTLADIASTVSKEKDQIAVDTTEDLDQDQVPITKLSNSGGESIDQSTNTADIISNNNPSNELEELKSEFERNYSFCY